MVKEDSMQKLQYDLDDIFVIREFFSPEECALAIEKSEEGGYHEATLTTAMGFVMDKSTRNNARVISDEPEFAAILWERAQPFLPAKFDQWEAIGFNERLRFYRYDVGQQFKLHMDGAFHRSSTEHSRLTFMIYLNDDFLGGETKFYFTNGNPKLVIRPEQGMALVFIHPLLHEGAPVYEGRKYVLRTDVMYRLK
jgi:hypothetical protein